MQLDVPTLITMLTLGHAVLALELWFVRRLASAEPALHDWTLGVGAMLVAFTAMLLHLWLPTRASVWLGTVAFWLGFYFYARAVYRFVGAAELPRWPAGLVAVAALVVLAPIPPAIRVVVNGSVILALLMPPVILVARSVGSTGPALRIVAVVLGLTAVMIGARAINAIVEPERYDGTLPSQPYNVGLFLIGFMNMLGAGFGFVLACFERAERRMRELATHDTLTGCVNRAGADALLVHALARARRERTALAYVVLDLDHFKRVNDTHGHRSGDESLRRFAQVVRARLRAADSFCRIGGEEFALLLPATDASGALRCVEAVRAAVEAMPLFSVTGEPIALTVSAGIKVVDPAQEIAADQVYQDADAALYAAKRAGRNQVSLAGSSGRATPSGATANALAPAGD